MKDVTKLQVQVALGLLVVKERNTNKLETSANVTT